MFRRHYKSNVKGWRPCFMLTVDSKSIYENETIPENVLEKMKEFNLFGVMAPKEYGGSGLESTEYARITEVEAMDSSLLLTMDAHNSLCVQVSYIEDLHFF